MAESKSFEEKPIKMSNNPNTASATESSDPANGAPKNAMHLQNNYSTETLKQLVRQVEYYFSETNLNKDTYVSTLRSLNDGYVPVSIIANFGKVRSLVPYESVEAICLASGEHSELLEVVQIDSSTGKRSSSVAEQGKSFVQAVGPIGGEPIPPSKLSICSTLTSKKGAVAATAAVPVSPSSPNVQNTVVLRDVPNAVQESDITQLFSFDRCPSVQDMHQDVANCWFVTLDTTSRDEMLEVMLALRQAEYPSGETVKARLKSGVAMNRDAVTAPLAFYSPPLPTNTAPVRPNNSRKNKKKKNGKSRNNSNNGKSTNSQNGNNTANKGKNNASNCRRANGTKSKDSDKTGGGKTNGKKGSSFQTPVLNLGGEQFPPLPSEFSQSSANKVEVEKVPTHYELGRKQGAATSDASSTATTSTSSSKSPPLLSEPAAGGGYAAALRKAPSTVPASKQEPGPTKNSTASTESVSQTTGEKKKKKGGATRNNSRSTPRKQQPTSQQESAAAKVVVKPPTWGHGSFADILRTEDPASQTAQS